MNLFMSRKGEHSRKPVAVYDLIARCSPGPYLELFARDRMDGWMQWGMRWTRLASASRSIHPIE